MRLLRFHPPFQGIVVAAVLGLGGSLLLVGNGLTKLRTSVIGIGGDPYQTLWRADQLAASVAEGSLDVRGDPIRNLGPLPWLPLHILLGEPLAYNVVWLLQAPLTVLAVLALGRVLKFPWSTAAFAGILAAFAPYRLAQSLGHFGAMQLFWIPATLAVALSWIRLPQTWKTILFGLFLIGTAWTEHTLFLTTLIALAITALCSVPEIRRFGKHRGALLHVLGLLALGILGIVLPFRDELLLARTGSSSLNPGHEQRTRFAPTLRSLVSGAPFHALRGTSPPYGTSRVSVADHVHAIGSIAMVASVASLFHLLRHGRYRPAFLLGGLAIVGIGIAMAPHVPGAASVLDRLPYLSAVRAVNRFLALPALALPLLASVLLQQRRKGISLVFAGMLLLEIVPRPPFPLQDAAIPTFYGSLQGEPPGPVLEVPAATDYVVASRAVYASTEHGRDVLGHIAFERAEDPKLREALLRIPFVRDVLLLRPSNLTQPTIFGQDPVAIAHAALASENITAIILHSTVDGRPVLALGATRPEPVTPDQIADIRTALRAATFREEVVGEGTFLYRIPPWSSSQSAVFAIADQGWTGERRSDGSVTVSVAREAVFRVQVLGNAPRAVAISFRPSQSSARGSMQLATESGARETWEIRPGTKLRMFLGTLGPGTHVYRLFVDALPLIVEDLLLQAFTSDT